MSSRLELVGKAPLTAFTATAHWVIDVRVDGDAMQFWSRLEQPNFRALDQAAQDSFDHLSRELEKPFAFALRGGALTEVFFPPDWSPFAEAIARTLASTLQFMPQPPEGTTQWRAREFDATGPHEVEYARPGNVLEFSKRKLQYESMSTSQISIGTLGAQLVPKVLQSDVRLTLGRPRNTSDATSQLHLARVTFDEKLEAQITSTARTYTVTNLSLDLESSFRREPALNWGEALAGLRRMGSDERAPQQNVDRFDATRIGNYTFESALKALEDVASDPTANHIFRAVQEQPSAEDVAERKSRVRTQGQVFTAMAAILRSRPERVKAAVQAIDRNSPAAQPLLDALSAAGTEEAQSALVGIMDDGERKVALRQAAAFSLIRTDTASRKTVSALTTHMEGDFLAVHATLGLGSISRRLRDAGEVERAEAIVDTLVQQLGIADSATKRVNVLRGIANSGHERALPIVRPYLNAKDEKVQAAALDAVRLMKHKDVDDLIAQGTVSKTQLVQIAALDAMGVREPTDVLAKALENMALTADNVTVRLKAVRTMGHWLPRHPGFRRTLEQVSKQDERTAVRKAALSVLGT